MREDIMARGDRPLYQQAKLDLERLIRSKCRPGDRLPSERELREEYRLSSTTVRRALKEHEKDGLIYRHAGLGTFVARLTKAPRLLLMVAGYDGSAWREKGSAIFGQLIGGASEVAWERQASLSIKRVGTETPLHTALDALISERDFDGIILRIAGDISDTDLELLESKRFPYVIIRRQARGREISSVTINDEECAFRAVSHLTDLGHHQIGLIMGPRSVGWFRNRELGYLRALEASDLSLDPKISFSATDYTELDGYLAAKNLFSSGPRPRALFIAGSELCVGAYRAFRELGLKIPDDVAVVGSDDGSVGDKLTPPLTAVTTSLYEIGVQSAQNVLDMVEQGRFSLRTYFIDCPLIIRESCGASRSTAMTVSQGKSLLPSSST